MQFFTWYIQSKSLAFLVGDKKKSFSKVQLKWISKHLWWLQCSYLHHTHSKHISFREKGVVFLSNFSTISFNLCQQYFQVLHIQPVPCADNNLVKIKKKHKKLSGSVYLIIDITSKKCATLMGNKNGKRKFVGISIGFESEMEKKRHHTLPCHWRIQQKLFPICAFSDFLQCRSLWNLIYVQHIILCLRITTANA